VSGARILLVEDDRYLRRACETALRQRGFTVASAVEGAEALTAIEASAPDLVLLDLLMPKVTGLEVLRALRARAETRALPVLILSNSSREQDLEEIRQLGVAGYYVKSDLSLRELGDRIDQLLAKG
jgi:two-component system, OmpR family, phosphate regulon response regulator PhoB